MVVVQAALLPAACHTPLTARQDARAAADVPRRDAGADSPPSDGPADASAAPDLADAAMVADLAAPDVAPETAAPDGPSRGPKAFRFDNHTASTAYVRVESPVACRQQVSGGWQTCSFFPLQCMLACGSVTGNCCVQCEQPLPSLYAIAPGESRVVPWTGMTYTKETGRCSQCECQIGSPVQGGTFAASASIYADYECAAMPSHPCQVNSSGIVEMATPRGNSTTLSVPFGMPYPEDEVVLDITSLPESDAGIDARASAQDASPAVDGRTADAGTCQPLGYSHFTPLNARPRCPVDPALPECASSDVGAIVYRDEACALATLTAHPDCEPWSRPLDSAYVFLTDPFGGCGWPITLDNVLDCGDHVDIEYVVTEPCQTCDAVHPSTVMLIIPTDRKPVRATATLKRERC